MVWIDNNKIVRQYINDLIKARSLAVEFLENSPDEYKVFFYKSQRSRNDMGYVLKVKASGRNYYYWNHPVKGMGRANTPLNKNGKLKR